MKLTLNEKECLFEMANIRGKYVNWFQYMQ